ncbi:DUF3108 domain-containing protein [Pontibacter sp. SGAir0037]|uniref:DUF3108 domain-containing protein n=1 Tax=Pontibacter sp. SGAir0037 TaxID=2571030 RepID=UPI0010CCF89E|nr:DUF3108 domain-containing protein [Pontibacter sp. SGAir0037]QCR23392.1 DUF3108 domain-containing protein [Pontibacter sp. SGAir0037]
MKKIIPALGLLFLVISGFVTKQVLRTVPNESFSTGEVLKYKVHYGPINAAEAVIDVAPTLHTVNGRPCYKATVNGKTTGSFDFFIKIRDTWQSYIDTAAILPMRYASNIEEGSYRKKETVEFNHIANTAYVDKRKKKEKETGTFPIPANAQDIVSGFYYLRTLNYDKMKVGERFSIKGFFDQEAFDMVVTFHGRETVSTKIGKINAIKLTPKMPSNKLFKGEDAITVYLSDDMNKIPVLIQANMFVGSVKVDLFEYKNLKHRIYIAQK